MPRDPEPPISLFTPTHKHGVDPLQNTPLYHPNRTPKRGGIRPRNSTRRDNLASRDRHDARTLDRDLSMRDRPDPHARDRDPSMREASSLDG